jgi:hypothetical protein
MKFSAFSAVVVASALAMAAPASAALDLTGLTLTTGHFFPALGSPDDGGPFNFTVGTSAPISYGSIADHAIGASSYIINVYCGAGCFWTSPVSFNGFVMSDAFGVAPTFTSATINPVTSYAGFDASRVTFDANNIYVDLQGLEANGKIVIDINGSGVIPEPGTWAMLIFGFGLVGFAARRRTTALAA